MPEILPSSVARRALRAQIAAHESWAHTADRSARTTNGRKAALDKFETLVDPDGELSPTERALRAEHARKAHFMRMALKSAKVRRARKAAQNEARQAAIRDRIAELDALAAGDRNGSPPPTATADPQAAAETAPAGGAA